MNHNIKVSYFLNDTILYSFQTDSFPPNSRGENLTIRFYRDPKQAPEEYRCSITSYHIITTIRGNDAEHEAIIRLKDLTEKKTIIASFDFEAVWNLYPRKQGRKDAERHFKAQIKTEDDYDKLKIAIQYYADKCKADGTDEKFISYGSSFINSKWKDFYIEAMKPRPEPPKTDGSGFTFAEYGGEDK